MTKLILTLSSSAVLLSSCAGYREPTTGNEATLNAPQPKLKDSLKFWGVHKPTIVVEAIDGSRAWNRWTGSKEAYKIAPGDHRISVFGIVAGMKHEGFTVMNFKARETYLIEAAPSPGGLSFEIHDSRGKTVSQTNSYRSTPLPQTNYIYVPAN